MSTSNATQTAAKAFIGRELGTVTVVSLVGAGAAGMVFMGFQRTLKRQVAVKILPKGKTSAVQDSEKFLAEAEIVAGLSHPNIIPIHEVGESDDCFFQVIQIVKGDDLEKVIKKIRNHPIPRKRLLPVKEAVRICLGVLDGLAYAHEEGVVHNDIKPANILLEQRQKRPLIADFGIASFLRKSTDTDDNLLGTPLYMAPEYVMGGEYDGRADLYSVGVMLFQMLSEELPLREKDPVSLLTLKMRDPQRVFTHRPLEVSPVIDRPLDSIILRAIAPQPAERYRDGSAFAQDLRTYLELHHSSDSSEVSL